MAPAFGLVEAKGLLPHFMDSATKVCDLHLYLSWRLTRVPHRQMADKWSNIIERGKSGRSAVIDANLWFGRATLDVYVLVSAFGVCGLRTNHELISQKGWGSSFRVRLWRIG